MTTTAPDVMESRRPDRADSPEPLRELLATMVVESRRPPLRLDSPDPRRWETSRIVIMGAAVLDSLREDHRRAKSDLNSEIADESLRLPVLAPRPASADDSLRLRKPNVEEIGSDGGADVVVDERPHGKLLARSASVSLRHRGSFEEAVLEAAALDEWEPPPPHSRSMSVNCARDDRRRLVAVVVPGGEVSCVSVGGDMDVIWAAESRRPAPRR